MSVVPEDVLRFKSDWVKSLGVTKLRMKSNITFPFHSSFRKSWKLRKVINLPPFFPSICFMLLSGDWTWLEQHWELFLFFFPRWVPYLKRLIKWFLYMAASPRWLDRSRDPTSSCQHLIYCFSTFSSGGAWMLTQLEKLPATCPRAPRAERIHESSRVKQALDRVGGGVTVVKK